MSLLSRNISQEFLVFLTAILRRGFRNDFFLSGHILFFPYSIWTFLFPFYISYPFFFNFSSISVQFPFLSNRGLILNFFQIFCHGINFVSYFRFNFNQEFQINLFQLEMVDCIKRIFLHCLYVYFMTHVSSQAPSGLAIGYVVDSCIL